MRATVVVPTRNRAGRLDDLLGSLAVQTASADEFEILVVDNGSTDQTAAVVESWAARRPGVRRIVAPVAGVSRARNAGIAAAATPIVAFLDDDVVADRRWMATVLAAYHRWPHAGIVCGRADLRLEATAPRWFGPEVAPWYSVLDFGSTARHLEPSEVPWALNLSVRTELARAAGGFPEHLGRSDTSLRGGEEAPLVREIRATGAAVVYAPDALVHHVVPADRLRLAWLLHRAWAGGLDARSTAEASGYPMRPGVGAALGRVAFRGWRQAARRARATPSPGEAVVAELCHRVAGVGAVWGELRGEVGT